MNYKNLNFKKNLWKKPNFPKSNDHELWEKYEEALENAPTLKPGMVLEMKDGKYLLVGDVNKHLGICDDCKNYEMEDIKRIAFLPGFDHD